MTATLELARQLLGFNTINPPGSEADCMQFFADWLDESGFEVSLSSFGEGRCNLIASLPGAKRVLVLGGGDGLAVHRAVGDLLGEAALRFRLAGEGDETARLLQSVEDDDPVQSARDLAMFELFYSSGLRLAELVALDCDALDAVMQEGEIRVLGKRSKLRLVPVGSKAPQLEPAHPVL